MSLKPFFYFVLCIAFFASCTKTPNHLSLIPNEAQVVSVYNVSSLIQKGDLLNIAKLETIKKLRANRKDFNENEEVIINQILDNPLSTGINIEQDWFSFIVQNEEDQKLMGFSAGVADKKLLDEFVMNLGNVSPKDFEIKTKSSFDYVFLENNGVLIWDNEKMLVLGDEKFRSEPNEALLQKGEELLKLSSGNQIVSNKSFVNFYNQKKDINVWFSSNLFANEREYKEFEEESGLNAEDNYLSFFLDFKVGEIKLSAKFDGNASVKEYIEDYKGLGDNFNTDLLAYLPADYLSFTSLMFNKDLVLDKALENSMVAMAEKASKVTPTELVESLGGSFALSIYDFKVDKEDSFGPNEKPLAAFVFDLNDKAVLEELITILPGNYLEKENGYFAIKKDRTVPDNIYLAINDEAALISNDLKLIKQFADGNTPVDNLSSTILADNIADFGLYSGLNYNEEKLPKSLIKSVERSQNREEKKMYEILKKLMKSVDFKLSNELKADFSLYFNDQEKNSLDLIITTVDENFETFENI